MKRVLTFSLAFMTFFLSFLSPVAADSFTDVKSDHPNKIAIDTLKEKGILQGNPDGTMKPDTKINRAEFMTILSRILEDEEPTWPSSNCFPDVKSEWYAEAVCKAKAKKIIAGYPDGSFKPASAINLAEALKILVKTLEVPTSQPKSDEWYSIFLESMSDQNYLPESLYFMDQEITRAQMSEMIWRIMEEKHDESHTDAEALKNPCLPLGENLPSNIDMDRVRDTWLNWYNAERASRGLNAYTYNPQLHRTAIAWSEEAKKRGTMNHKRDPNSSTYYDYPAITSWFKNLGLEFKNIYRVTYTENIGWGPFSCNEADCTDELLSTMKYNFDYYMNEEGSASDAHFQSIVNKYFKEIGLGVAIDENAGKMYMTIHYGTEITSNPYPVCGY